MKIFDCFTFFSELDLLEFRLKLLDEHVDHFVLTESNITHSGQPKPFYFEENKARFEKWLPRIIYLPVHQNAEGLVFTTETSYNPQSSAWKLENGHRNALSGAASLIADDDIVLLSDLDEIPDPFVFKEIKPANGPVALSLLFHYYFLNCQNVGDERWWNGTIASKGKQFKATTPQELRDKRNDLPFIKKAGWHFSYLGGLEKIKEKIRSFAHTEFNKEEFSGDKNILEAMEQGTDIFKRPGVHFGFVSVYYYPAYLRKVMIEYPALLYVKGRESKLQQLYYSVKNIFR